MNRRIYTSSCKSTHRHANRSLTQKELTRGRLGGIDEMMGQNLCTRHFQAEQGVFVPTTNQNTL